MILTSGRIVPNWILQLAFMQFDSNTTVAEVITDIEDIVQDELNKTARSRLSVEDALEVFKKFNDIQPDYEDVLDEFFEKHGLGHDEYDGDDDEDGGDVAPDSPEDNALHPEKYEELKKARR